MARTTEWAGRTVVDRRGEPIGEIDFLYVDESGRPEWAGVLNVRLLGTRPVLVPLRRATVEEDVVRLRNVTKDHVSSAPYVSPESALSDEDEALLLRHYRLPRGVSRRPRPPTPPNPPGKLSPR